MRGIRFGLCLIGTAAGAWGAPADVEPLKAGHPDGRGPFALRNLHHHLMGAVRAPGAAGPDLFVAGSGGPKKLWLARWSATAADGAPVFHPPAPVASPFTQDATVFQPRDGTIRAAWHDRGNIAFGRFDADGPRFIETRRMKIQDLPGPPSGVAVFERHDGSFDLVFEVGDGTSLRGGDPWTPDWRPYDAAGIWTGGRPFRHLVSARIKSLESDGPVRVRQASATDREVFIGMYSLAPIDTGTGGAWDLVAGSKMGNFWFFRGMPEAVDGARFERRRAVQGVDGAAVRNPFCFAGVISFPDAGGRRFDLIAGGEGALQYYRFSGSFSPGGAPLYHAPRPVLQEAADLYAGTLPVPSVVDWDGDGALDIVSGNSEGRVLFFKNLGTDAEPRFAPGEPVMAGGREIHVQAGYSGSVQGIGEARWGYSSPNVTDWNGNGLPDIVMGDITGNITVYINRGTPSAPALDPAVPIYCEGLDLHGQWRVRPAVARIDGGTALITVDDDDHLHLYWRVDDRNVESAGKLRLTDGSLVSASSGAGGMVGRCKLSLFDWDGDGRLDLILGTARHNAIPNPTTGFPKPTLGERPVNTVLFMRNAGTNREPVYEHTVPFVHATLGVLQPGGAHESGAVAARLGPDGPNLLVANETGRFFLLLRANLSTAWAAEPSRTE